MKKKMAVSIIVVIFVMACGLMYIFFKPEAGGETSADSANSIIQSGESTQSMATDSGSGTHSGSEPSVVTEDETDSDRDSYNWAEMEKGGEAANVCMDYMFGGISPENFIDLFSQPEKKSRYILFTRWYFSNGVEIDVQENDHPSLENYIYISDKCDLKTDRGIGTGSTYDEVMLAYQDVINRELTNDDMIVIGAGMTGINFIIENDKVDSIFISNYSLTGVDSQGFTTDRYYDNHQIINELSENNNSVIMGAHSADEIVKYLFGGYQASDFISVLGEPEKKADYNEFERWYFTDGVEIDVYGGENPEAVNYIYIGGECDLKTDRGIGTGSTSDEVTSAYQLKINSYQSDGNTIVLGGSGKSGVTFILKDNEVAEIYISTMSYTPMYFGDFTADR